MKNPIQPIRKDAKGTLWFKSNAIVEHLLEVGKKHGCGLNDLCCMEFSDDDRQQFAQLIGYSLSGYGSLNYVNEQAYLIAANMADGMDEHKARTTQLEQELHDLYRIREQIRKPMAQFFCVDPEALAGTP